MAFKLTKMGGLEFGNSVPGPFDKGSVIDKFRKRRRSVSVKPKFDNEIGEFVVGGGPRVTTVKEPNIASTKESEEAAFSTLYNDLYLGVQPHYNYYEDDEDINDERIYDGEKLEELPRFVRIVWDSAPKLDREPQARKTNKRARKHSFFYELEKKVFGRDGVVVDEEKINDFDDAVKSAANGFYSPGSITAVVEVPLEKRMISNNNLSKTIDEIRFLESEKTHGINIGELNLNLLKRTSGMLRLFDDNSIRRKENQVSKQELYDGKYTTYDNGDEIKIENISSTHSSVNINVSVVNKKIKNILFNNKQNEFDGIVDGLVKNPTEKERKETKSVEVVFADPGLTQLANKNRVTLAKRPEHLENIGSMSPYFSNLFIFSNLKSQVKRNRNVPKHPAPKEENGIKYIGYVIEKYKQNRFGVFELAEEIKIPDRKVKEYIDTKVVYGGIYRYRIRSVLAWSRKVKDEFSGLFHISDDKILSNSTTYFLSDWNREWRYGSIQDNVRPEPPDQFVVRSQSNKKHVSISWRVPDNRQKDIYYYVLYKKIQDKNGSDLCCWERIGVFFGANNVLVLDDDVDFYQNIENTYVYAAATVTKHDEVSYLTQQIGVRLNQDFIKTGEFPVINVSDPGVNILDVGQFSVIPTKRKKENVSIKDKVLLTGRTGIVDKAFLSKTYCLRIHSLDLGQTKDVKVNLNYNNLKPKIRLFENVTISEDFVEDDGIAVDTGPSIKAGQNNVTKSTAKHSFLDLNNGVNNNKL